MIKHCILLLFLNILLFLPSSSLNASERGEIVSYELVEQWENKEVVNESIKLIEYLLGGLTSTPTEKDLLNNLLTAYIKKHIQARSLKFYKLKYHTIDFEDQPAIASGLVIVPQRPNNQVCSYGIGVYNHGTLFGRYEAPSYFFDNGQYRSGELFFSVIMAAMELFTLVPDYYGLGDGTGIHHHNMDKTNSNSVIDMMRAARKMASEMGMDLNERVSITGYSEGGTVTMATAKRIFEEGLQDEFPRVFLCPASGAYDLSDETYKYILNNPFYPTRSYILYIAASCHDLYKNMYDPNDPEGISYYLKEPYDELYNINLLGQTGNVGWVPLPWPLMFNDGVVDEVKNNPNHPLRTCLEDNNVYDWPNPYETLIFYCNTDEQVPPSGAVKTHKIQQSYITSSKFWDRFRLQLHEVSFGGLFYDHGICALPSILASIENMKTRRKVNCSINVNRRLEEEVIEESSEIKSNMFAMSAPSFEASVEILGMDNQTYTFSPNSSKEYNISKLNPGIYLYKTQLPNVRTDWDYFIKTPLQYVNTDDYNPVQKNQEGLYFVDISLLSERVKRLDIYSEEGDKIKSIPNTQNSTSKIEIKDDYTDGNYTIMVVTQENNYPLKWEVSDNVLNVKTSKFQVYMENGISKVRALSNEGIKTIELFDTKGRELIRKNERESLNTTLNLSEFPVGVYLLRINGAESHKIVK